MTAPRVALGKDARKSRWRADVTWPDGTRSRHLLPVSLDDNPDEELADFERRRLPKLAAARAPVQPAAPRDTTRLRDLAVWYLETHLAVKGASPRTAERYAPCIWHFVNYMSSRHVTRTAQLSTRLIEEWQLQGARDKHKDKPVRNDIVHVRRWLGTCADAGECPELPRIKWSIPKAQRGTQHSAYPPDVITAWVDGLAAWRPMAGLVARWVACTGWRIADVLDLRVGEVDRERGRIDRVQLKTDANLPYPISPALEFILDAALAGRKRLGKTDHVFVDAKRRPWEYKAIYRCIENYHHTHWEGEPITFRDLRKSFATNLAMAGCPPNVLKELLGHADIKMTLGYYVDVDMGRMSEWLATVATPWQPPQIANKKSADSVATPKKKTPASR